MTKYGDISKSASDLLNNDYCFDRKFKLKTKTANGVEFTVENVMGSKGVAGKLTTKCSPMDGIKVEKAGVKTDGRLFGEFKLTNAVKGAEFTLKAEDGAGKAPAGNFAVNYSTGSVNLDANVDVVNGPTIYGAGTFGYDNFTLGGEVKYNTDFDGEGSASVQDYNGAVAYSGRDFTASLTTKKKASSYSLAYHHSVNASTTVATQFDFSASAAKTLTVGGIYKWDSQTKFQGKFDSNGVASANWIQVLRPQVKLISSAQVNAKDFSGDSHKFGMSLILG